MRGVSSYLFLLTIFILYRFPLETHAMGDAHAQVARLQLTPLARDSRDASGYAHNDNKNNQYPNSNNNAPQDQQQHGQGRHEIPPFPDVHISFYNEDSPVGTAGSGAEEAGMQTGGGSGGNEAAGGAPAAPPPPPTGAGSGVDQLDSYLKQNGALRKIMKENSEVAKEVGTVFQLLSQREGEIAKELNAIKESIKEAATALRIALEKEAKSKEDSTTGGGDGGRQRRSPWHPYRACVSIEPMSDGSGGGGTLVRPQSASIQEYMPSSPSPPQAQVRGIPVRPPATRVQTQNVVQQQQQPLPSGVDLNEVYWLRLDPQQEQAQLRQNLDNLLESKQYAGKDVLVIPVSQKFQDVDQVKDGFMRAVRVRPEMVKKSRVFRELKRLQIYEMI